MGVSIDYPDAERHDHNRGLPGTTERAWRAVDLLRDAAPHGGRQVHVMTVLMRDNADDLGASALPSAEHGVGHCLTLLSVNAIGREKTGGEWPLPGISATLLLDLWRSYPHFRIFRGYLERMDPFLSGGPMPTCRAGLQSFNIDHVGNVSPCIEKIDHRWRANVPCVSRCERFTRRLVALWRGRRDVKARLDGVRAGSIRRRAPAVASRGWIDLGVRMRVTLTPLATSVPLGVDMVHPGKKNWVQLVAFVAPVVGLVHPGPPLRVRGSTTCRISS